MKTVTAKYTNCRVLPEHWVTGRCWIGDQEFPTVNPPRKLLADKPTRVPKVEPAIQYGPFSIVATYRVSGFAMPHKVGYLLWHPETGVCWRTLLFKTVPDARAFAVRVAETLSEIIPRLTFQCEECGHDVAELYHVPDVGPNIGAVREWCRRCICDTMGHDLFDRIRAERGPCAVAA